MTEKELSLVNNVAQKLEVHMKLNNQTIFALAKIMNIDKQPFYRIINRKNVPTLSSLYIIAENLNCTIQELIDNSIFIDILVYASFDILKQYNNCTQDMYRIYIPYEEYLNVGAQELFAIKLLKELKIYYKVDNFMNDGLYWVNYNNQKIEMEILSAGSKLIIAAIDGKEYRIDSPQIIPLAKHYKTIPITSGSYYAVKSHTTLE